MISKINFIRPFEVLVLLVLPLAILSGCTSKSGGNNGKTPDGMGGRPQEDSTQTIQEFSEVAPDTTAAYSVVAPGGEPPETTARDFPTPQIIGEGSFSRSSDQYDENWNPVPPWTTSYLQFSLFALKPSRQDSVIVIPTQPGLPGITVQLRDFEERVICDRKMWEVESIDINKSIYRAYKSDSSDPFDFVVLQPRTGYFQHVTDYSEFASSGSDSPRDTSTIEFAVDVTGDQRADIIQRRFCCDNPSVSPDSPDAGECYRCTDAFHRIGKNEWKRIFFTDAC